MGIKEWIIPQEKKFFDMLNEQAAKIKEGTAIFNGLVASDLQNIEQKRAALKRIEHEADNIVHNIYYHLNKTFITPIDREDISELTNCLDDIIDITNSAANRIYLYKIEKPSGQMKLLSKTLLDAVEQVASALACIRDMKNAKEIKNTCIEINRLENVADDIMNQALADLFKEEDAVKLIKFKEIYESLEAAIDKCEDVADIISDILVKHG